MAMEKSDAYIMADPAEAPVDLRNVPLRQLGDDPDARRLVASVMANTQGASLVTAGFNAVV
jgi:hypothetical protein